MSAVDDRLLMAAAELIDDLGDVALRERRIFEQAWQAGYRVGYEAGHQVGHERAHHEIADDWAHMAERIRSYARTPKHAELERIRYPHHTPEQLARLRGRDRFPLPPREDA